MKQALLAILRGVLRATLYRVGTIARIRVGPARGLRYRIFADYGIAPVFGRWEPSLQKLLTRIVRPGMTVYDIGANYGIHTLVLSRLVGESGAVFAFEPDPDTAHALRENVALNGLRNVRIVERAVGGQTGRASFARGSHRGAGHVVTADDSATFTVDIVTFDDFVFTEGNPPPDVVKMDVEGAEAAVIENAARVMAEVRPAMIIELHTPEQDVRVGRALLRHSYSAVRVETGEQVARLDQGWPARDGVWGQVLATPDKTSASDRENQE